MLYSFQSHTTYSLMPLQFNIFLLLFGALQGILLSIWFLKSQPNKVANRYFAFFLVVVGSQLIVKVITKAWMMDHAMLAYKVSYLLPYLVAPLLFLYVKARRNPAFEPGDLLHLIPFLFFSLTDTLSIDFYWLRVFNVHPYTRAFLQLSQLCVYGYLAARLCHNPLRKFIWWALASEGIIAVTLAVMLVYNRQMPDVRLLFIVLTILIYWITYRVVSVPDFFINIEAEKPFSIGVAKSKKYSHSGMKPDEAERLEKALLKVMEGEKLFLDSSLTIDSLAIKLASSRHHLSQLINERLKKSYFDLVNDYRLEEAKLRLSDPAHNRYTIAAIALDSGFSSVSNFNEVFKKKFCLTPSRFRSQSLKRMSA